MMGIFDILFEILPYLIWGAGPFCVFKGMGTGKDSGKLLFKKIYSDGGVSINEDSTSLDISATGVESVAVDVREIAFGNPSGNGLTSSTFISVEGDSFSLVGFCDSVTCISIIGGTSNCNYNGAKYTGTSMIVGGSCNKIKKDAGDGNIIAGGNKNYISVAGLTKPCNSSILSGNINEIKASIESSIISGFQNCINRSCSSAIISSKNSEICCSVATFISGSENKIKCSCFSNTSGHCNEIYKSSMTFVSGYCNIVGTSSNSSILNGCRNRMGSNFRLIDSVVANGYKNYIKGSSQSSILNGYYNEITNENLQTSTYVTFQSAILNGQRNKIISDDYVPDRDKAKPGGRNIILNGYSNCIRGMKSGMTILNGRNNSIKGENFGSVIFNGSGNIARGGTILHGRSSYSYDNALLSSPLQIKTSPTTGRFTIFTPNIPANSNYIIQDECTVATFASETNRQGEGSCGLDRINTIISNQQKGIIIVGTRQLGSVLYSSYFITKGNYNCDEVGDPILINPTPPFGVTVSGFGEVSIRNNSYGNSIFTPISNSTPDVESNIIGSYTASYHELDRRVADVSALEINYVVDGGGIPIDPLGWPDNAGTLVTLAIIPRSTFESLYGSSPINLNSFPPSVRDTTYCQVTLPPSAEQVAKVDGYYFSNATNFLPFQTQHVFIRNSIISQGSRIGRKDNTDTYHSLTDVCSNKIYNTSNRPQPSECPNNILKGILVSDSTILGGINHIIEPKTIRSAILGGENNEMVRAINSAIIAGSGNKIDGFFGADASNASGLLGATQSLDHFNTVILGGCINSFSSKPTGQSGIIYGNNNNVIIGGYRIVGVGQNNVTANNLALYCCLSYYNFSTSTKSDGITCTTSGTIASLTVCNGIIVSLT